MNVVQYSHMFIVINNDVQVMLGRQRNSAMAFSRIHPIILPKKHPITTYLTVFLQCSSELDTLFTLAITASFSLCSGA